MQAEEEIKRAKEYYKNPRFDRFSGLWSTKPDPTSLAAKIDQVEKILAVRKHQLSKRYKDIMARQVYKYSRPEKMLYGPWTLDPQGNVIPRV